MAIAVASLGCGAGEKDGQRQSGADAGASGRSGGAGGRGGAGQTGGGTTSGGGGSSVGGSQSTAGGSSGTAAAGGMSGVSGGGTSGRGGGSGATTGGSAGAAATSGTGNSGTSGAGNAGGCDAGTTETAWATTCPTTPPAECVAGTWTSWGSSSPENYPLRYETEHFAFLWPDGRDVDMGDVQAAGEFMEEVLWPGYLGNPVFWPEPYCSTPDKLKTSIHIIEDGLFGGCNAGRPGIWVGPGAMRDHWGLAHEWMHALQCMSEGFADCGAGGCWIYESHANFMPHQLEEFRGDVHCSEMLVNAPHLYYGSTRDRYCNWQFFEFLKDKHCYRAVNEMWTNTAPNGQSEPWHKLARNLGTDAEGLNDLFGEWALHNVTWDYRNPPPASGDQGAIYRQSYGSITSTTTNNSTMRRLRLTRLEPLTPDYATERRFVSPYFWAPQRWGYNVVRLYPEVGATTVTVTFRGVTQDGANSGWRFGLVATEGEFDAATGPAQPRYSTLQRGPDATLSFCVSPGEALWLLVVGAPTALTTIVWDQPYPSIHRYPYMVELSGAWPEGFRDGMPDPCPEGTARHANGGGCAPAGLPGTVYVGPYAQVLGGSVTGAARIEDQAVVLAGATVSGGVVGALSVLNRFTVRDEARVQTTFYPPGFFESGQGVSGDARLYGDVEYRGQGLDKSSGSFYGFVDSATASAAIQDVTPPPPYAWRP